MICSIHGPVVCVVRDAVDVYCARCYVVRFPEIAVTSVRWRPQKRTKR